MAHKAQGRDAAKRTEKKRGGGSCSKDTGRHQGKRISQLRHTTSHK